MCGACGLLGGGPDWLDRIGTPGSIGATSGETRLAERHHRIGARILRTKGLFDVPDAHRPVVLDAVQRHIHPPFHLGAWPDLDRASRLVFIGKGLDPDRVRTSLDRVLACADRPRLTVRRPGKQDRGQPSPEARL